MPHQLIETNLLNSLARTSAIVCLGALMLTGCQTIDYRQVAYEALRSEDCRRNELDTFCTGSYSSEYHEYKRMRNEFLRNTDASGKLPKWRTAQASFIRS